VVRAYRILGAAAHAVPLIWIGDRAVGGITVAHMCSLGSNLARHGGHTGEAHSDPVRPLSRFGEHLPAWRMRGEIQ
jgi:hypothetical protein